MAQISNALIAERLENFIRFRSEILRPHELETLTVAIARLKELPRWQGRHKDLLT